MEDIAVYRYSMISDLQFLQEFDSLWGIDHNGYFSTGGATNGSWWLRAKELFLSSLGASISADVNVAAEVIRDLGEVQKQYTSEITIFQGYTEMNKIEKRKRLLFLFQCDLLPGVTGLVLQSKAERDNGMRFIGRPSITYKYAALAFIAICCSGMMFYILLFAISQSDSNQSAWFRSFILWICLEIFFVSTFSVLFTNVLVPSLVMRDIAKLRKRMISIFKDASSSSYQSVDENTREAPSEKTTFNSAEYFFVSFKIAKHFPDMSESKIISRFCTPWPKQPYHISVPIFHQSINQNLLPSIEV